MDDFEGFELKGPEREISFGCGGYRSNFGSLEVPNNRNLPRFSQLFALILAFPIISRYVTVTDLIRLTEPNSDPSSRTMAAAARRLAPGVTKLAVISASFAFMLARRFSSRSSPRAA